MLTDKYVICGICYIFLVWSWGHTQENSVTSWCAGADSDQQWRLADKPLFLSSLTGH